MNSVRYTQRIIQTVKSREADTFSRPDNCLHDTADARYRCTCLMFAWTLSHALKSDFSMPSFSNPLCGQALMCCRVQNLTNAFRYSVNLADFFKFQPCRKNGAECYDAFEANVVIRQHYGGGGPLRHGTRLTNIIVKCVYMHSIFDSTT